MTTELPPPLRLPASDKFETFFSWPSFRQSFLLLHADMGKEEQGGGEIVFPHPVTTTAFALRRHLL